MPSRQAGQQTGHAGTAPEGQPKKPACSRGSLTGVCTTARRFSQITSSRSRRESIEEALVLGARAIGDANVARAAEALAASDHDALLAEPADQLGLVQVVERDPGEVGLRLGRLQAELAQSLGDEDTLDDRSLDALGDVVGVQDRLGSGRLSQLV